MTSTPAEQAAMLRALALAASPGVPLGPNPRVGCVLLDDAGEVVAEGHHRGAGTPHAEADALARAGAAARGTTAVVTLEPCNHTGRTGPCAEALVAAGVRRVVFAQPDTNPVAAGGAAHLRAHGVEVEGGLLERRGPRGQPRVDLRRGPRAPVRHLEVRHHARRTQRRRRRHLPLGLEPGRADRHPPAAGPLRHDAGRCRDGGRRRPAAHRARRARPAAPVPAAAGGDGQARPRRRPPDLRRRRARRQPAPAHPRPARGARRAARPRPPARLPRGRTHARGGVPDGRAWSTRSSPTSPRCCSAPAPSRWPTSASPPSPTRSARSSPT